MRIIFVYPEGERDTRLLVRLILQHDWIQHYARQRRACYPLPTCQFVDESARVATSHLALWLTDIATEAEQAHTVGGVWRV